MGRRIVVSVVFAGLAAGCGSSDRGGGTDPAPSTTGPDPSPVDAAVPDLAVPQPDLRHAGGDNLDGSTSDIAPTVAPPADGGAFMAPPNSDPVVTHAPPTGIASNNLLPGLDTLDVSVDQGGGVWAVTSGTVYYLPGGRSTPFTYDQRNGLARGQYTWVDIYFTPGTYPVSFSSVAGATPGQAIVGEFGTVADRLEVNPSTGAVTRVDNMAVTMAQVQGTEYPEHLKRVVAVWKSVVDLNGTFSGTAYLGGWHGFYAFHGIDGDCGCLQFEEHQHYITDSTIGGSDVKGLAISSHGDLFEGDREYVTLLPQRSKGANTDFFAYDFVFGIDVFPNVNDEVIGLAADAQDGLYVASDGNGLAYLAPATHTASYWSSATTLPQNHLRGVAIDGHGDVWVATDNAGLARFRPSANAWSYYTTDSGLPSNHLRAIYFDKLTSGGKIYVASDNGIAVLTP
jgi:hypothetical protein